jgi:hypothetical protein
MRSTSFIGPIELDPDFAAPYGMAVRCYARRKADGWTTDRVRQTAETARLARGAAKLGKDDAVALCNGGFGLAYVVGDLDMRGTATTDDVGLNEFQRGEVAAFLDVVEEDARRARVPLLALAVLATMTLRCEEMWPALLLDLFAQQSPSRRMVEAVCHLWRGPKLPPHRRPELPTFRA